MLKCNLVNLEVDTSGILCFWVQVVGKWEPTVKGTLTGAFDYFDNKLTDQQTFRQPPPSGFVSPVNSNVTDINIQRQKRYEIAYYYRFNPQAAFLAYYSRLNYPFHHVRVRTQSPRFRSCSKQVGIRNRDRRIVSVWRSLLSVRGIHRYVGQHPREYPNRHSRSYQP